ncbi:hypothetical protein BBO99_00004614 [Phytophthora kernoviae]|uniref:THH1/TOM1/TOM3 domain-containing protein n=2 Tax=Phytophthora kernoviae TaxID=325452 RepID=A0A3R7J7R9_9STRA|nr:hypothetical protein G195_005280 [Phytophthora kernoviae 00238/432]KAG2525581.1 hypothetical protein JM16_004117 [Phytophthora kernoviae]KAG2527269.1 hypothetical protein JM18_003668 [Phytophthora kernoviae]RLN46381.1 hypothetical protein BBI17_004485 [Phytophthora kernoviae]RLN80309.1 hypothetical protein BBO99_00004614 [Phytophthora kernoviae]
MSNITDATCDYGLAQTEDGCVRTLASYDPDSYLKDQIIYLSLGLVSVAVSGIMYVRSVRYEGSKLQQYNFLFCVYASMTMVISGADPKSYGHVVPRPISSFLSDSLTAALYSVYILTLGYWATIIQRGAAVTDRPAHLVCLESIAIAVVWAFYVLYNVCLFLSKGYNRFGLTYLHLTWSAVMLAIISTVFLIYGLRILSRLQSYERQQKLRMPTMLSEQMMNRSFNMGTLSDDENGVPVVQEPSRANRRKPKEGHAAKIRKILYVVETLSLLAISAQMYMAVTHTTNESKELQCANGIGCENVKSSLSYLNILQVVCIWVVLWAFHRIKKKEVVPRAQARTQPRSIV